MFNILENLNPVSLYTFKTVEAGSTLPLTVKEFLSTKFGTDEIDMIGSGFGETSQIVWSKNDGWNPNAFAQHVRKLTAGIDATKVIGDEFIASAINEKLSVFEAVSVCFKGSPLAINLQMHAKGLSGFLDIDVQFMGSEFRAVFKPNISQGDMFNLYYGDNSKGGAFWDRDLKKSISNYYS